MKTLTYTRPHNLSRLHADLHAAMPSLRPVEDAILPFPGMHRAVMFLASDGETVTLIVPDDTDEAAAAAVLAAHDPTPDAEEGA